MRFSTQTILRVLVVIASAVWMGITFVQEFVDVDPTQYGITAPEAKQRMQNCSGSYQQRADCKERILDQEQRAEFIPYLQKVATIIAPPLALWFLVVWATRDRRPGRRTRPAPAPAAPSRRGHPPPRPRPPR